MPLRSYVRFGLILPVLLSVAAVCLGQSTATIGGTVHLGPSGQPMHNARIILSPLGRSVDSDDEGKFEFRDVPPGSYQVIARSPGLADDRKVVRLNAGATETLEFTLRVAPIHESITVTATGKEESTLDVMQPVTSLEQTDLQQKSAASLGEVLETVPGIAKRSFGPGTARPVVRGFDGDRVLILEDGIRTGTLSSQSGDHGEPVDVNSLERLEVVRGPGTLLYGSNAIGGVVNAVSRHDIHKHPDPGVRGFLTGVGGSNNDLGGGSGGFEFGVNQWQFWASGGGQRTDNYYTPIGEIANSQSRLAQTNAGLGRYGEKGYLSFNYAFTDSRYGIPFDPNEEDPEIPELLLRRHSYRIGGGLKDVGFLDGIQLRLNYSDYDHQEIVGGEPETLFFNNQFVYRTVFDQKKRGRFGGSFGFWGMHRDYKTEGEESLAPPTTQNSFAAFALESFDFETTHLQFGGRVEHNQYNPTGLRERSFTGFSGAVGLSQRLWPDGAFVVNYSHSYRAPAIEELYNNGPHPGNLAFEVGNPDLKAERNNGLDISVRHQSARVHGELNFFYYHVSDFVYLAPTGNIEDGLREAEYLQENSRFIGSEAKLDLGLHPNFWINLGADTVNARLKVSKTFLPRIPPLRGRVGFDARYKGLSFRPELVMAYAQNKTFPTESPTAGYTVVNLAGSYTIARPHHLHVFSANLFNAGDRLYLNHLSFIKEFAPELGRGVRFGYTVQLF
jgi:iron complex outermembrane receptor protein